MKVLSLFDGVSCGRLALERAGIPVEKYYASEIDKYAIQVAQKNYPDTIQVGDVTKLNYLELLDVDIVIGGSPCQDLSIAKQNRQGLRGARSGLFWKYVEALEVIHPKYFLLENVASMRNEDRDAITDTLRKLYPETECIMINSALVSAQQRKRYYWTNWHVEQPQDKGILLKDILESGQSWKSAQANAMPVPERVGTIGKGGQGNRIYSVRGKSVCLNANGGGRGAKTGLYKVDLPDGDYIIRKLTPVECARLQTMPDNWCELGLSLCFQNTYDIIKSIIKGHSRCKNVELKTAQIQYPTSLLDYATSIICDLSDMEQQSSQETQLTKQNTVLLMDVIKNNKQDADIVLNTIKDLKEQEALNYQKENQRNVSIAIEWQLQEKCVIGTIKIGNATMMHNLQIRLEKEQINTDIKRLKEIIESNIEKSFQSCSEENYMHKKWYTILTWINLIIIKKIYTSVIIPNTQVFINSLIKLRENLLDLELSNLKTESITSISPTQQYKCYGNGWTVDVIAHILRAIPST